MTVAVQLTNAPWLALEAGLVIRQKASPGLAGKKRE